MSIKHIIGLDISTTAIGMCLIEIESKKLVKYEVFEENDKTNIKERMKNLYVRVKKQIEDWDNFLITEFVISKAYNQFMNKYISILEGMISAIGFNLTSNVEWSNDTEWYSMIKSKFSNIENKFDKFGNKKGRVIKKVKTLLDFCDLNNFKVAKIDLKSAPMKVSVILENEEQILDDVSDAWAVAFYWQEVNHKKYINLKDKGEVAERNKLRTQNRKLRNTIKSIKIKIKELDAKIKEHTFKYQETNNKQYEKWIDISQDKINKFNKQIKEKNDMIIKNDKIIKGE